MTEMTATARQLAYIAALIDEYAEIVWPVHMMEDVAENVYLTHVTVCRRRGRCTCHMYGLEVPMRVADNELSASLEAFIPRYVEAWQAVEEQRKIDRAELIAAYEAGTLTKTDASRLIDLLK